MVWRYVSCRAFAEHLGYDWGVSHPGWRGPFLNMDWGKEVTLNVEEDADFRLGEVFNLVTADGGTTWYGYEEVNNSVKKSFKLFSWGACLVFGCKSSRQLGACLEIGRAHV